MSEFGTQLKQARERQGISLRQIATSTKISVVALEALERGDFSRLPGGIFSRAFVRSYALEVGLDADEVVNQFLQELEAAAPAEDDTPHPDVTDDDRAFLERQRKAGLYLRVGLVVVAVAIVIAIVAWRLNREPAQDTPPVTQNQSTPITPPPADPLPSPAVEAEPDAPTTGLRVELVALDNCWLQATADGSVVPARVLSKGQRQLVEAEREIVLNLGSAGAVTWTLNGRPGRPLGEPGEVKTVTISSENLSEFWQGSDAPPTPNASGTDRP